MPGFGAGDGSRTRDIQLGRLTLYRLSYSRSMALAPYFERTTSQALRALDRAVCHSSRGRMMPLPDAVDNQLGSPCPQCSRGFVAHLPPAVGVGRIDVEVLEPVGLEDPLKVGGVDCVELLLRAGTGCLVLAGDDDEVQRRVIHAWSLACEDARRGRLDAGNVSERLFGSRP